MSELDQKRLKQLLHYDPDTGEFTWKVNSGNGTFFGNKAGSPVAAGYIYIQIQGKKYRAHRLAFLYMTGKWPKRQVDHINRVRDDNRWSNLRDVTQQLNNFNTGGKGYGWHKATKKYVAYVRYNRKDIHLGLYDCQLDARAAHLRAKNKIMQALEPPR
jgi:hypothetical protein